MQSIEKAYTKVIENIGATHHYYDLVSAILELAEEINAYKGDTEAIWYLGEHTEFCLMDFIPAAYWHFAQWHGGQNSLEYRALSALGGIFTPNMSCEPEKDDPEYYAFITLGEIAANHHTKARLRKDA